ncbi:hypothetical protein ANANG_G00245540 [Anguilla anguilla]|uniref:Transmembrane protein 88 n=1 Tax=Anguilla anguilla TaxID=7936 RepID=A0A9D3LZI4_ANGAN|nr:hypothetical protein ANANG_G00245540 [Anguilla anguilla]
MWRCSTELTVLLISIAPALCRTIYELITQPTTGLTHTRSSAQQFENRRRPGQHRKDVWYGRGPGGRGSRRGGGGREGAGGGVRRRGARADAAPADGAQRSRGVGGPAGPGWAPGLGRGAGAVERGRGGRGALLLAAVFTLVLLPATLLLSAGFLCHSRVLNSPLPLCGYLDDNSCSALIILGFVMMSPLVVLAAAMFCGLVRRLRLLLLFQPMSRACYRGGGGWGWGKNVRAWV